MRWENTAPAAREKEAAAARLEKAYLTAYLDECGRNRGRPLTGPALERFLPWNASPEDLQNWAKPPPGGQDPPG